MMPGALLRIGLNGLRTSMGASGLGSQPFAIRGPGDSPPRLQDPFGLCDQCVSMAAQETEVRDIRWHSDGVFELRLERGDVAFRPGDCVALHHNGASRPYSIASGIDEDHLAFVIRRMPGGEVSEPLAALATGDKVRMSAPFGWFRPGAAEPRGPAVFFATGTGVSPFLSWFRSHPDSPPRAMWFGVRSRADAVELDRLRERTDLHLAVSREDCDGAHRGRVTDLLDRVPVDADTHYYLCGLDAMIDEVSGWLEARGVRATRIHRECFFNSDFA